jgi:hypothetical protein
VIQRDPSVGEEEKSPSTTPRGENGAIEVTCDPAFWSTVLGTEVQALLDEWVGRGWVEAFDESPPSRFRLTPAAWNEASVARQHGVPEDERQRMAEHVDALCRLVSVPGATARVRSSSFLGAPDLRFVAEVEREGLTARSPWVAVSGPECVHPELVWLDELLRAQVEKPASTLESQLRLLGDLRRGAAHLERCGSRVRILFDEHLDSFEIVEPERIGLRWERDDSGRYPTYTVKPWLAAEGGVEPLPVAALARTEPVVKLGQNKFAVLSKDAELVLRRVRADGQNRTERAAVPLIADPTRLIPEGVSTEDIDLSEYGARVLGFVPIARGDHPFDIQSSGARWFAEESADGAFIKLSVRSVDPAAAPIPLALATPDEARRLRDGLRQELEATSPKVIDWNGVRVVPTRPLVEAIDVAVSAYDDFQREHTERPEAQPAKRRVVILDERRRLEGVVGHDRKLDPIALNSVLASGTSLKPHQREGIEWLWRQLRLGRTGVLLADEMGLGKTLQIACFLALQRKLHREPAGPTLIIAPVILIENWQEELQRFLRPEAFEPLVVLHGDGLRRLKRQDGSLEVSQLRGAATVLTNYDTLDRHQVSLLKVDWRAVVLDEAQNIKNPETCRSRAARALKRDFAICSTGTPVENKLLDLWTLFDFLSPLDPLGTQPEFRERFEGEAGPAPAAVARALEYPSPDSKVLRRTKDEVLDLEPKTYEIHRAPMTDEQMALEKLIVRSTGPAGDRNTLEMLSKLRSLYQHPWLLRSSLFGADDAQRAPDLDTILSASPKLRVCLDILERVRERGEKALVFSPWIKMQQLLAHTLRLQFGVSPRIINGDANQRRQALGFIRDFSSVPGFNVLVLSPLAAGAGLNIVAANHVIHYGRWWNPAKEDQATDRAYRIGQTRPVTVHYPILHHAGDPSAGFDVALHDLVERKRALARHFLSPEGDVTTSDIRAVLREGSVAA